MAKDNENKEVTIMKINSVISLYNSSFEEPAKWPIDDKDIEGLDKEKIKSLLSKNKDALFRSPSNGVAGINWGAMSDASDLRILDNKIDDISKKLYDVLSNLDGEDNTLRVKYQAFLDIFKKEDNGFSRTYNVLAARLVVTFALGKLFAVPGNTQIFQVAEELGFVNYNKPDDWIVANLNIVKYVKDNCQAALDKLYGDTTKSDSFEGKRKFTMLGWRLALLFGAGNNRFEEEADFVLKSRNVVYSGAPGTGKSFMANKIARVIVEQPWKKSHKEDSNNTKSKNFRDNIEMVQFHPSYDYTDFVEGMRPYDNGNGNISFKYTEGVFRKFCEKALDNQNGNYVFIIDEINRGDVNKIFGELFFCLDPDKRYVFDGKKDQCAVKTQYANLINNKNKFDKKLELESSFGHFFVPENVYIIATMNDIDRSVESLDFAFRRRFAWKEVKWEDSVDDIIIGLVNDIPEKIDLLKVKEQLKNLNKLISKELGSAYCIGGSFIEKLKNIDTNLNTEKALKEIWASHIENVIREYLRGTDLNLDNFKNAFIPQQTSK